METRLTADDLDAFMALRSAGYVTATEIDRQEYEDAGFVSAINDTRFYPKRPGGPHTRDARHVRDLVLQFESDEGANTALDFLQDQGAKPCPGTCATRITEFDVDGTPGAKGLRRLTSAEELKATGAEGEPNDSWTIRFAEGPFAYEIQVFGTPGEVSEEHEAIAQKLHDRVENAPPR